MAIERINPSSLGQPAGYHDLVSHAGFEPKLTLPFDVQDPRSNGVGPPGALRAGPTGHFRQNAQSGASV